MGKMDGIAGQGMEWVCYSLFSYPYSFPIIHTWDQIYHAPYFPIYPTLYFPISKRRLDTTREQTFRRYPK
jgi:hypothetical protein